MSADCGKLKNSNYFRRAHKGDFPKFGHNLRFKDLDCVELLITEYSYNIRDNTFCNVSYYSGGNFGRVVLLTTFAASIIC